MLNSHLRQKAIHMYRNFYYIFSGKNLAAFFFLVEAFHTFFYDIFSGSILSFYVPFSWQCFPWGLLFHLWWADLIQPWNINCSLWWKDKFLCLKDICKNTCIRGEPHYFPVGFSSHCFQILRSEKNHSLWF